MAALVASHLEPHMEEVKPTFPPVEHSMARYQAACHAMQTGVMYLMQKKVREVEPKHLRVGVNSAMVESSALAGLLIKHGIINEAEWYDALATSMEKEAADYQKEVEKVLGVKVTLI